MGKKQSQFEPGSNQHRKVLKSSQGIPRGVRPPSIDNKVYAPQREDRPVRVRYGDTKSVTVSDLEAGQLFLHPSYELDGGRGDLDSFVVWASRFDEADNTLWYGELGSPAHHGLRITGETELRAVQRSSSLAV